MLRDHGYGASVLCAVPVYAPTFSGTHFVYTHEEHSLYSLLIHEEQVNSGQAEFTWVSGYMPRGLARSKTVTRPTINRARRRVTSLLETNALPLSQTATSPTHHFSHQIVVFRGSMV